MSKPLAIESPYMASYPGLIMGSTILERSVFAGVELLKVPLFPVRKVHMMSRFCVRLYFERVDMSKCSRNKSLKARDREENGHRNPAGRRQAQGENSERERVGPKKRQIELRHQPVTTIQVRRVSGVI